MLTSEEACEGLESGYCREEVYHEMQPVPTFTCL